MSLLEVRGLTVTFPTDEERVAAVRGHRSRGNELFFAGDAARAIREYSMALTYLTEDFMMQLFGAYEEEAHAEFVAAHGNLAAAHLRLESYADALTHVAFVLKVDDANAKAYYRRGKARFALGQEDAACEDYVRSQRLAGGADAAVAAAIRELDAVAVDHGEPGVDDVVVVESSLAGHALRLRLEEP